MEVNIPMLMEGPCKLLVELPRKPFDIDQTVDAVDTIMHHLKRAGVYKFNSYDNNVLIMDYLAPFPVLQLQRNNEKYYWLHFLIEEKPGVFSLVYFKGQLSEPETFQNVINNFYTSISKDYLAIIKDMHLNTVKLDDQVDTGCYLVLCIRTGNESFDVPHAFGLRIDPAPRRMEEMWTIFASFRPFLNLLWKNTQNDLLARFSELGLFNLPYTIHVYGEQSEQNGVMTVADIGLNGLEQLYHVDPALQWSRPQCQVEADRFRCRLLPTNRLLSRVPAGVFDENDEYRTVLSAVPSTAPSVATSNSFAVVGDNESVTDTE